MLQHILNIFKKSSPENDTYVFQGESEYTSNDGDYEQGKLITFNAIVPLSDHDSAMNLLCLKWSSHFGHGFIVFPIPIFRFIWGQSTVV